MEESEKFSRRDWDSMSPSPACDVESVGVDEKRELRLMLLDWGCCCCF